VYIPPILTEVLRVFLQSLGANARVAVHHQLRRYRLIAHSLKLIINALRPQWQVCVPPALTVSDSAFCIYGSYMFLTANRDYC
jgi:hypothetical protein